MGTIAQIDNTSKIRNVLLFTLLLNVAVALSKVIYGYASNSIAMTSDGFHSFFDGASNILGLIGIWIASHPPDEKHPYGHRKYETLFTIIIGLMIFATCFQIIKLVYHSFVEYHKTEVTTVSFAVMFITISVNIFVTMYESKKGRELKSEFLLADAMHTKSDILASVGVIAGLIITRLGFRLADTIVGAVIVLLIARIGYDILKRASDALVDTIRIDNTEVTAAVNQVRGVMGCHGVRTRGTEHLVYLDLHILVDPKLSAEKAHDISDSVEEKIKALFPSVADIVVHIEPDNETERNKCS